MSKRQQLPFLILFLLINISMFGQQRFGAGIIAGLNFSELEGNGITDYYGLNAGVIGTMKISKHAQLGVELLFSQNGEYVLPEFYPNAEYGKVWLNHIEVPIHIDWLIAVFKKEKFHDWNLNLGIAYTRLIGHTAEDIEKHDLTDFIVYENREAFLLQAGTTYLFTKNIGLNLKTSIPIRIEGLDWTIAARVVYMIS